MSHQYTPSVDSLKSTCKFIEGSDNAENIECTAQAFLLRYNSTLTTESYIEEARAILEQHKEALHSPASGKHSGKYDQYKLLTAMIDYAPNKNGKRYVAIAIYLAGTQQGSKALLNVASAWLDSLFFPMLTLSMKFPTEPSSAQTPTLHSNAQVIESAGRKQQQRELTEKLQIREGHRCAITGVLDSRFRQRQNRRGIVMNEVARRLEVAHIIPLALNSFAEFQHEDMSDAGRTWDMLQSWTCIEISRLIGSKLNEPENAIYMAHDEHSNFGQFQFYLDADAYPEPNKYKVVLSGLNLLTTGKTTTDVIFNDQSDIPPPNPEFIRLHAAFAKVLHLSGAAEYFEDIEEDAEEYGTIRGDGDPDLARLLTSRLLVAVHRKDQERL